MFLLYEKKGQEMKKNIMNRLGVVLVIIAMLALSLAGCGGSDVTGAIRDTAEGFMSAMEAGDIDKISEYSSEEMFEEDGDLSELESIINFRELMLSELGVEESDVSQEALDSIDSLKDTLLSEFIKSYEIKEVAEEDGVGNVTCDITYGYNVDSVDDADLGTEASLLSENYTSEHLEELVAIYNEQGEEALTKAIINGVLPEVMTILKDRILSSEGESNTCVLKIENIDGKWLVTEAKLTD